ncbi:hypothetical protein ACQBAU_06915 [Propionibacteriaceae bacterium Y2011]|uniref:hypothetical protein n=1 Tax=Microlunatus sp. Y2014 TaxID=3418488 RepID=UPI003B4C4622
MPVSIVDPVLAAVRLTVWLNSACWAGPDTVGTSPDVAARTIVAGDAAHHVVDRSGLLGLDPLYANELSAALSAAAAFEQAGWVLAIPRPGHLGPLRGPAETNQQVIAAGAGVLARTAGVALVPEVVGGAVQWTTLSASNPATSTTVSEGERAVAEAVLSATAELSALDVAGGDRPTAHTVRLPKPYEPRRQRALDRGLGLYTACTVALTDEGSAISSFETQRRRQVLTPLVGHAADLVCAVCSTPPTVR